MTGTDRRAGDDPDRGEPGANDAGTADAERIAAGLAPMFPPDEHQV